MGHLMKPRGKRCPKNEARSEELLNEAQFSEGIFHISHHGLELMPQTAEPATEVESKPQMLGNPDKPMFHGFGQ